MNKINLTNVPSMPTLEYPMEKETECGPRKGESRYEYSVRGVKSALIFTIGSIAVAIVYGILSDLSRLQKPKSTEIPINQNPMCPLVTAVSTDVLPSASEQVCTRPPIILDLHALLNM